MYIQNARTFNLDVLAIGVSCDGPTMYISLVNIFLFLFFIIFLLLYILTVNVDESYMGAKTSTTQL